MADDLAPSAELRSIFESDLPLEAKLDRARTELLDLSVRNRLLNIPRSAKSAKTLEVIDQQSAEIFRLANCRSPAISRPAHREEVIGWRTFPSFGLLPDGASGLA
jgi:hypothetical protein